MSARLSTMRYRTCGAFGAAACQAVPGRAALSRRGPGAPGGGRRMRPLREAEPQTDRRPPRPRPRRHEVSRGRRDHDVLTFTRKALT